MFEVPKSNATKPANRFQFSLDGKAYDVPLLKFAPVPAVERFEVGEEVAGMLLCMDGPTRIAVQGLDGEQLADLKTAWIDAGKVSPGESDGSADS